MATSAMALTLTATWWAYATPPSTGIGPSYWVSNSQNNGSIVSPFIDNAPTLKNTKAVPIKKGRKKEGLISYGTKQNSNWQYRVVANMEKFISLAQKCDSIVKTGKEWSISNEEKENALECLVILKSKFNTSLPRDIKKLYKWESIELTFRVDPYIASELQKIGISIDPSSVYTSTEEEDDDDNRYNIYFREKEAVIENKNWSQSVWYSQVTNTPVISPTPVPSTPTIDTTKLLIIPPVPVNTMTSSSAPGWKEDITLVNSLILVAWLSSIIAVWVGRKRIISKIKSLRDKLTKALKDRTDTKAAAKIGNLDPVSTAAVLAEFDQDITQMKAELSALSQEDIDYLEKMITLMKKTSSWDRRKFIESIVADYQEWLEPSMNDISSIRSIVQEFPDEATNLTLILTRETEKLKIQGATEFQDTIPMINASEQVKENRIDWKDIFNPSMDLLANIRNLQDRQKFLEKYNNILIFSWEKGLVDHIEDALSRWDETEISYVLYFLHIYITPAIIGLDRKSEIMKLIEKKIPTVLSKEPNNVGKLETTTQTDAAKEWMPDLDNDMIFLSSFSNWNSITSQWESTLNKMIEHAISYNNWDLFNKIQSAISDYKKNNGVLSKRLEESLKLSRIIFEESTAV
jgi:hypothetical protein